MNNLRPPSPLKFRALVDARRAIQAMVAASIQCSGKHWANRVDPAGSRRLRFQSLIWAKGAPQRLVLVGAAVSHALGALTAVEGIGVGGDVSEPLATGGALESELLGGRRDSMLVEDEALCTSRRRCPRSGCGTLRRSSVLVEFSDTQRLGSAPALGARDSLPEYSVHVACAPYPELPLRPESPSSHAAAAVERLDPRLAHRRRYQYVLPGSIRAQTALALPHPTRSGGYHSAAASFTTDARRGLRRPSDPPGHITSDVLLRSAPFPALPGLSESPVSLRSTAGALPHSQLDRRIYIETIALSTMGNFVETAGVSLSFQVQSHPNTSPPPELTVWVVETNISPIPLKFEARHLWNMKLLNQVKSRRILKPRFDFELVVVRLDSSRLTPINPTPCLSWLQTNSSLIPFKLCAHRSLNVGRSHGFNPSFYHPVTPQARQSVRYRWLIEGFISPCYTTCYHRAGFILLALLRTSDLTRSHRFD
ncbi:hypothetical protein B0H15DRAFT_803947 [Mycena belliarum]|uniref:Uncharacterized protein n=2 Tax=Mycena belliarum TaxID=1033014 RepID=A0AAD6TV41_9AGAR|nr:hypothetical protein B0H15DRAFT_803947 [Mycena belliae]